MAVADDKVVGLSRSGDCQQEQELKVLQVGIIAPCTFTVWRFAGCARAGYAAAERRRSRTQLPGHRVWMGHKPAGLACRPPHCATETRTVRRSSRLR